VIITVRAPDGATLAALFFEEAAVERKKLKNMAA